MSLINGSILLRDLVDEAKDFHLMPQRRPHLPPFKTRQRSCSSITGLIYAVGGLNSSGQLLIFSKFNSFRKLQFITKVLFKDYRKTLKRQADLY